MSDDLLVLPSAVASRAPRRWLTAAGITALCFVFLATTVVVTGGNDRLDPAVVRLAHELRTPALDRMAGFVTQLGSWPAVLTTTVLVAAALRRRTGGWIASAVLGTATVVTLGSVFLLKVAIARPGPSGTTADLPWADYAFPSGHTTDGTVVIVLSAVLLAATVRRTAARRLLIGGGMLIALAVGATRVYLGYHWATDVLAGWFLAAAVICAALAVGGVLAAPIAPTALRPDDLDHPDALDRVDRLDRFERLDRFDRFDRFDRQSVEPPRSELR